MKNLKICKYCETHIEEGNVCNCPESISERTSKQPMKEFIQQNQFNQASREGRRSYSKMGLMGDSYNNLQLKIADFKIKISALMTGISFILCILFFLPLVHISSYGSISGYELATEIKDLGQKGDPSNFILLIMPLVLFIMFAMKNFCSTLKGKGKSYYISVVISILAIIFYLLWKSSINSTSAGLGSVTVWFYVTVFGYLIMTIIASWCILHVLWMNRVKI